MTRKLSFIGLPRGTVQLRAYNPAWAEAFRIEVASLTQQIADAELPPLLFEHIGSTAVAGLEAKPIIDLMGGLQPGVDACEYFRILQTAGYERRGPQGVPEREFFVRGPEHHRTHHLNLTPIDGAFWRDHLIFRDRLRDEPVVRLAYAALKRQLASRHSHDRAAYTAGKARFVSHTVHGGLVPSDS